MRKLTRSECGFTLLEILVSMLLLAVTLVGGMALYHNAERIMALMVHKKVAMELANERMEAVRNTPYSTLDPGIDQDFNLKVSGLSAGRVTTVSIPDPNKDLKEVRVNVRWDEAGQSGGQRKVEMISYVAK